MPPDFGERRHSMANQAQVGAAAPPSDQQGHLPCPRCDSSNTKFCYYNNYNFSQPRHFCKTCRRYWTHGGTLRDIPVGGGSRKSTKRCRTTAVCTATYPPDNRHIIANSTPVFVHHAEPIPFTAGEAKPSLNMFGSFTSLLNTPGSGLFTLGGFGLGLGSDEDTGFGLGRPVWQYTGVEEDGGNPTVIGNTWQVEGGDDAFGGGDCFSLPGLAISTPGNALK